MSAAVQLLAQEGYGGTSMRAIAEKAQVAVGSLYVHYGSKNGLVNQLFTDALKHRIDGLEKLQHEETSVVDVLMAFIDDHFDQLAADEALATVLLRESQNPLLSELSGVKAFKEELPRAFKALLEEGVASGELRPLEPCLVSHLIFHMIRSAAYERQLGGHRSPQVLREELKTFIKRAIVRQS